MSSKIRECIKELQKNRNQEQMLPEYVKQYMMLNGEYAKVNLMMEYYMFYETVTEGINPYIESAKEIADAFHDMVSDFFEKPLSDEERKEMAERLLVLRQDVTDRMQVLTAYVDCFVVYEYVLNRVQYRFEDQEFLPADEVFAQELVNFIFSGQDQSAISDNIRFVLGQLPVRMARSRYFELIRDSISVYKGSERSSLEGYLYMFRTSAMLYHDENMGKYFQEFVPVLEELASLEYETIDEKTYQIYAEKIRVNASKLNDVTDLYMQLGKLINHMYIICASVSEPENTGKAEDTVIRGINALFLEKASAVFEQSENVLQTEEEKLYWLGEQFAEVEGKQESLYERLNVAGAALEEIEESQRESIGELGLAQDFQILKKMFLLTSNSTFADLSGQRREEKVSAKMAEDAADTLIEECRQFFRGKSRMLRRAVMANTLEKMPVFFTSAQEVADYVMNALLLCEDAAEKYAAKQLLSEFMH